MGRPRDEGISLVEVLTSLAVVAIVVAAVTAFFVTGLRQTRHQGQQQVAAQLALGGIETARGLRGATILGGRLTCSGGDCVPFPAAAQPYLAGSIRYDRADGAPDLEIVNSARIVLDQREYRRYMSVGKCYRASEDAACGTAVATAAFYRVVVAVTWTGSECPDSTCVHTTAVLLAANATEPLFQA